MRGALGLGLGLKLTSGGRSSGLLAAIFFAIGGQSNASGRGVIAGGETSDSRVTMFGNDYNWKTAYEPADDWTNEVDLVSSDSDKGLTLMHSFMLTAGKNIALNGHGGTGLIPCPKGGTAIQNWLPKADKLDRTTLFGSMNNRVKTAGGLNAFWWFGHEANSPEAMDAYNQRWYALVNELRLQIADQPMIYVQLGKHQTALNNTQQNSAGDFQRMSETGYNTDPLVVGAAVIDSDFVNDSWTGSFPNATPDGWSTFLGDANNYLEQNADGMRVYSDGSVGFGLQYDDASLSVGQEYLVELDMSRLIQNGVKASGQAQFAVYNSQAFFRTKYTQSGGGLFFMTRNVGGQVNDSTIRSIKVSPYTSGEKWSPLDRHHMVVAFDQPLIDIIHLDADGQREVGRRIGLATRQHVLGESVNGTGPRLVDSGAFTHPAGDKSKVNVTFDSDISNGGGTDYDGQFRVFDDAVEMTVSSAVVDPGDSKSVLITMTATATGTVTVSYGDVVASGVGVTLSDVVKDSDSLPAPQFSLQTVV